MKHMWNMRKRGIQIGFVLATITSLLAIGCDDPKPDPTGSGGSGGGGGGGSGGGTACIDPSTYENLLSIKDSGFCAVAYYDTDFVNGSLTWGRHGGPMFIEPSTSKPTWMDMTRLTAPEGFTTGKLVIEKKTIDIGWPMGTFLGGQAIDLPFFNWTAVSYTSSDANSLGEVILLDGINVQTRYAINGLFSAASVGVEGELGRMLYSGLSPINKTQVNINALYSADACGALGNNPRLVTSGDATCSDSFAVEAFGDYSGPVAADANGNVFVVMSYMDGQQEAKGYAADAIKRGALATTGESLFKISGYAGALAAVTPDGTGTGVFLFQPKDPTTFAGLDVIAQRYAVEGGKIVKQGLAGPFVVPTQTGADVNFTTDPSGRVWVAMPRANDFAVLVLERKI